MNGESREGTSIGSKMACLKQYMKRKCDRHCIFREFAGSYILADTRLPLACTVAAKKQRKLDQIRPVGFQCV